MKYTKQNPLRVFEAFAGYGSQSMGKTAQYKMAGNSIVVSCLYHIFKSLFIEKPQPTTRQLSLF